MGLMQWISEKLDENRIKTKERLLQHLAAKVEAQEKLIELENDTGQVRDYLRRLKKPEMPRKSETPRPIIYKRE